jgi:hypothetical protein
VDGLAEKLRGIADDYAWEACSSLGARTKREQRDHRSTSYGYMRSLEALLGHGPAVALLERACTECRWRPSPTDLLHDFWKIEPATPADHAELDRQLGQAAAAVAV